MYRFFVLFLLLLSPLSAGIELKRGEQVQQRELFLEASRKEVKGISLFLPYLSNLDFLKLMVEICQTKNLAFTVLTKNTKRNQEGIAYLRKNQVSVICYSPKKQISFPSYFLLEGQKSIWLHIEPLFRKTTYSKIPCETIWIQDEAFYQELYQQFTLQGKE